MSNLFPRATSQVAACSGVFDSTKSLCRSVTNSLIAEQNLKFCSRPQRKALRNGGKMRIVNDIRNFVFGLAGASVYGSCKRRKQNICYVVYYSLYGRIAGNQWAGQSTPWCPLNVCADTVAGRCPGKPNPPLQARYLAHCSGNKES